MSKVHYNTRTFLNEETSHYTGSIVCFDGEEVINQGRTLPRYTFVEISDCHGKVRIHKDANLPMEDFVHKLRELQYEIEMFIEHLDRTNI